MSKLSHSKAVTRRRRQKHGHVKRYSRKEMLELMPNFSGQKVVRFTRVIEAQIPTSSGMFSILMKIDKNNQICDCTRVGNVFTYLYGRNPEIVNWEYRFNEEYEKLCTM